MIINADNKQLYKRGVRNVVFPNLLFTIILFIINITPFFARVLPHYVRLAVFLLWALTAVMVPLRNTNVYGRMMIRWWSFYVIWLFLMCIVGHSNCSINFFLARLSVYGVPYMMLVVMRGYNLREMKIIWNAFLLILFVNLGDNYILGISNPEIFENIKTVFGESTAWYTNAGDTLFVNTCLFAASIYWLSYECSYKHLTKIYSIVTIIVIGLYICVINSRGTAAVIMLIMATMFIVLKKGGGTKSITKGAIGGVMVIVLVLVFSQQILSFAVEVFSESPRMLERLNSLLDLSQGASMNDIDNSSIGVRFILWTVSIQTFFSSIPNFLIGVGEDIYEADLYSLMKYGVGGHSEFFDLAAKYGIVGVVTIFKFLSYLYKFLKSYAETLYQKELLFVVFLTFLFYNFVNLTFEHSLFYVIMVVMPLTLFLGNKKVI